MVLGRVQRPITYFRGARDDFMAPWCKEPLTVHVWSWCCKWKPSADTEAWKGWRKLGKKVAPREPFEACFHKWFRQASDGLFCFGVCSDVLPVADISWVERIILPRSFCALFMVNTVGHTIYYKETNTKNIVDNIILQPKVYNIGGHSIPFGRQIMCTWETSNNVRSNFTFHEVWKFILIVSPVDYSCIVDMN